MVRICTQDLRTQRLTGLLGLKRLSWSPKKYIRSQQGSAIAEKPTTLTHICDARKCVSACGIGERNLLAIRTLARLLFLAICVFPCCLIALTLRLSHCHYHCDLLLNSVFFLRFSLDKGDVYLLPRARIRNIRNSCVSLRCAITCTYYCNAGNLVRACNIISLSYRLCDVEGRVWYFTRRYARLPFATCILCHFFSSLLYTFKCTSIDRFSRTAENVA